MTLYVIVTYDMEDALSKYTPVNKALASIGFEKDIVTTKKHKKIHLPANMFARLFESDDTEEKSTNIRKDVVKKIKRIFKENEVRGRYFVFVGKEWSWKVGRV